MEEFQKIKINGVKKIILEVERILVILSEDVVIDNLSCLIEFMNIWDIFSVRVIFGQ